MESLTGTLREVAPRIDLPDAGFVVEEQRQLLELLRSGDVDAAAEERDRYLADLRSRWLNNRQPVASRRAT
ncbi:hypothetical protein MKW14_33325 [Streptomyces sp. CME 23]|nr:hypothetical protein [Streptomyces sp. CME 23]